jgi:hypothetical protein
MISSSPSVLCIELLRRVARHADDDFAGVGFVVYSNLSRLPHLALRIPPDQVCALPLVGVDKICEFIAHAARSSSPLHDGFHLIELSTCALTHACHFIAPAIPSDQAIIQSVSGARHMSALLASRIVGIDVAALVGRDGVGVIFEGGSKVFEGPLR